MQSAPARPQAPRPSAPARPEGIVYAWEQFSEVIREALPLLREHWKELALYTDRIPLNPNWEAVMAYERSGMLAVFTARSNGALVGYNAFIVAEPLHYLGSKWAKNDVFWLHPSFREGWTGIRLLEGAEQGLKERGVQVIDYEPKEHFQPERGGVGRILKRLGYAHVASRYSKFIGDRNERP